MKKTWFGLLCEYFFSDNETYLEGGERGESGGAAGKLSPGGTGWNRTRLRCVLPSHVRRNSRSGSSRTHQYPSVKEYQADHFNQKESWKETASQSFFSALLPKNVLTVTSNFSVELNKKTRNLQIR